MLPLPLKKPSTDAAATMASELASLSAELAHAQAVHSPRTYRAIGVPRFNNMSDAEMDALIDWREAPGGETTERGIGNA